MSISHFSPAICKNDLVDLLFVIDTSKSVENDFYKEKAFALDLIKVLPLEDFEVIFLIAILKQSIIPIFNHYGANFQEVCRKKPKLIMGKTGLQ